MMFPEPTGVKVPAQLLLGVVAQETNVAQASWHAADGDTGNPLIADYYGNGNADIDSSAWNHSDCGYGIGQVTDGMRITDTTRTLNEQIAIATDYQADIAGSLRILADTWGQTHAAGTTATEDDPAVGMGRHPARGEILGPDRPGRRHAALPGRHGLLLARGQRLRPGHRRRWRPLSWIRSSPPWPWCSSIHASGTSALSNRRPGSQARARSLSMSASSFP
ncbi:hypothetical protein [Streptomyces sp. NPDC021224]|uniref:hypothetical protein n=1 Tax=unclassified Streptomyces TaxID=2593676 RepID=UPI003790B7DB